MRTSDVNLDKERRKQILEAALSCFLQFGFAKTSMDDVATKANLSRPLIYLKFKNKHELFLGLYSDFMSGAVQLAESVLKSKRSKKQKLLEIAEVVTIRGWEKIVGHPMTAEFYPLCQQQLPKESKKLERSLAKIYQQIFDGDKGKTETFMLAIEGLHTDIPAAKVLRKRLAILISQFSCDN